MESLYALGALCLGVCLLLVLGTQVLHPLWLWLLLGVALGVVSYRVRQHMLAPYRVAQRIDAACGFHDAISTAWHFEKAGTAPHISEEVRRYQREQAEQLVPQVDLARVFPFHMPRAAYASVALFAIGVGLFAYRFGVTHKLDLQQPLIAFHIDAFQQKEKEVAQQKKDIRQQLQDQLKQMGVNLTPMDGNEAVDPNDPHPFNSMTTTESADNAAASPGQENSQQSDRQGNPGTSNEQIPGDKNENSKGNSASTDEKGDAAGQDGKDGQKRDQQNGAPQPGNPQNAGNNSNSKSDSNLLSKLRDNIANMMNKLKSPSQDGEQQQQSSNQSKQNQGAAGKEGQKASSSPSRNSNQQNAQGEQQQGDQQGEGGDKTQSAASKQGDKSAQQPSSDAKSGVGKQDGDKDVRAAEQLAAMGKLSELLGKRSQTIAGEITVETPSGKQQLLTPYSQRRVTHAEAGGESNRDEIPLAYQHYVQQYFEQIHHGKKAAAAPPDQVTPKPSPN